MGLLRTLLIILLVYLGLKTLARIFTPLLLRFVAKKAEERFEGNFQTKTRNQEQTRKEGEISIDKVPTRPKKNSAEVGEYIDFEELD